MEQLLKQQNKYVIAIKIKSKASNKHLEITDSNISNQVKKHLSVTTF